MNAKLKRAIRSVQASEEKLGSVMRTDYPVGGRVRWGRGGYTQRGEVIMHGYQDRLKVLNHKTGRELWIHAYDIE